MQRSKVIEPVPSISVPPPQAQAKLSAMTQRVSVIWELPQNTPPPKVQLFGAPLDQPLCTMRQSSMASLVPPPAKIATHDAVRDSGSIECGHQRTADGAHLQQLAIELEGLIVGTGLHKHPISVGRAVDCRLNAAAGEHKVICGFRAGNQCARDEEPSNAKIHLCTQEV
ncbi:MAG: hypothetical protein ACKO32_10015 [Planctomycetia bacterium]